MRMRLVVCLLAAMPLLQTAARAADKLPIGKLDGERVFKEYKRYQKLNEDLQALGRRLLGEYDERKRKHPLLLDDEWNELLALRKKGAAMTPTERQKFDKLQRLSEDRDHDLAELEGQAKLDDKQQTRWRELVAIRAQAQQMLQDQWDRIQKEGAERSRQIESELAAEIRVAVKKVAEAQNLAMVVNADVVVYGGIDITDETLKILNATPPAGGTTPPK